MIRWLQPLWRPTLVRRVLAALLLAFGLVAAALLALDFVEFKRSMNERPGVQRLADAIATSLQDIPDQRDAALVVQTRARELNQQRRAGGQLDGDVEFSLTATAGDGSGPTLYATPGAAHANEATHWVAHSRTGHWLVSLAEPRVGDATVLGWLGQELIGSLLLAFPLVLLPLWIALQRGLRPLNLLADAVGKRDAHDLSPLGLAPQHDELKPLAIAFDGLLARLRQQLQRERAFVQDAAHELRTPMAVVAAQAHLLAHATSASEREQAAAALHGALQRAAHLSRQLLTLATLDETHPGAADMLDLSSLVEQTLAQLAPRALAGGLELSLEAPAALPTRADRTAIESVLLNLVDNALRYVPQGGHVAVTLRSSAGQVTLRVADDGPGIPPTEREAAFERFWRGTTGTEITGTGLGLAIVRRAALRLGGSVHITDGLQGRGCGLVVTWPQVP